VFKNEIKLEPLQYQMIYRFKNTLFLKKIVYMFCHDHKNDFVLHTFIVEESLAIKQTA
jgi:hypothetical protein